MLDVSNYTYNKAIAAVNSGDSPNFYTLRTKIVTSQTRTGDNEYQQIMASIKELTQQKKNASPKTVTTLEEQIAELRNRKKQIPFVLAVDLNENGTPKLALKNIQTGHKEEVALEKLIELLK